MRDKPLSGAVSEGKEEMNEDSHSAEEKRKSKWRDGLSELSGGQKTILSICFIVAVSKMCMRGKEKGGRRGRSGNNRRGKEEGVGEEKEEKEMKERADELAEEMDELGLSLPQPNLMLLDEIDANLDEANQKLLARLLSVSFSEVQIICVSHLPGSIGVVDCSITLDKAKMGKEKMASHLFSSKVQQQKHRKAQIEKMALKADRNGSESQETSSFLEEEKGLDTTFVSSITVCQRK
eukprot:MONOS_8626.1-p1 / transcript=MONOS_8626.1 / gene=MONOS_8626 / organism=Monocercomonoides_exilis_PA203 / gene_product=unspecified product / transcript_product=unspecified product / location=Mono_scaffold00329:55138-56048(-) / protein_length=236 / sequence_SO=supercontig / SO=protein_coding / is_pseudo=false